MHNYLIMCILIYYTASIQGDFQVIEISKGIDDSSYAFDLSVDSNNLCFRIVDS